MLSQERVHPGLSTGQRGSSAVFRVQRRQSLTLVGGEQWQDEEQAQILGKANSYYEKFLIAEVVKQWSRLLQKSGVSILGDTQNSSGQSLSSPFLSWSCSEQRTGLKDFLKSLFKLIIDSMRAVCNALIVLFLKGKALQMECDGFIV